MNNKKRMKYNYEHFKTPSLANQSDQINVSTMNKIKKSMSMASNPFLLIKVTSQ